MIDSDELDRFDATARRLAGRQASKDASGARPVAEPTPRATPGDDRPSELAPVPHRPGPPKDTYRNENQFALFEQTAGRRETWSHPLSPPMVVELQQMRAAGRVWSSDHVQAWWEVTRPRLAARGVKRFWRACVRWWQWAPAQEIEACLETVRRERDIAAIEKRRATDTEEEPPPKLTL